MNLEKYAVDNMYNSLKNHLFVESFKKIIEKDGKNASDQIMCIYNRNYPDKKRKRKRNNTEWRRRSIGMILFDPTTQNALALIPNDKAEIILLPPYPYEVEKQKKVKPNELVVIPPETIPQLNKDVTLCIFKYLKPQYLLSLRVVCKMWNRIIVNEPSFWKLKPQSGFEPSIWSSLPLYRQYINRLFLNVKNEQDVIDMFRENILFFKEVAKIDSWLHYDIVDKSYHIGAHILTKEGITNANGKRFCVSDFVAQYQAKLIL
jgi:hypothetical protein